MDLIHRSTDTVLAYAEVLICNTVVSTESKRAYRRAIRELIEWCEHRRETQLNKAVVSCYRAYLISRNLSPATINQKLSAIRTLAVELADAGRLSPTVCATIGRVRNVKSHGTRYGRWLAHEDAERLIDSPDKTTLKGKRDRALLAVCLGCGIRRNELASLTVEMVQRREGRWVLVDIRGKHGRIRSVPMPGQAKEILDEWLSAAGIDSGCAFRAIDKKGRVHGNGITAQAVYEIVTGYGIDIGVAVAPHDLRRSFARLSHSGKSPIEQIQLSLGHASVATTERYIGVRQNLIDAPCDRLGLWLKHDSVPESEMDLFPDCWAPPGWLRATSMAPVGAPCKPFW